MFVYEVSFKKVICIHWAVNDKKYFIVPEIKSCRVHCAAIKLFSDYLVILNHGLSESILNEFPLTGTMSSTDNINTTEEGTAEKDRRNKESRTVTPPVVAYSSSDVVKLALGTVKVNINKWYNKWTRKQRNGTIVLSICLCMNKGNRLTIYVGRLTNMPPSRLRKTSRIYISKNGRNLARFPEQQRFQHPNCLRLLII